MDITGQTLEDDEFTGKLIKNLRSVYSVLLLVVLWLVVGGLELVHPFFIPPLPEVIEEFWNLTASNRMIDSAWLTISRALLGLAIATVFAIPVGLLAGRSSVVGWFWNPIIAVGYPIPVVALIPVFRFWFGFGELAVILLVALGCFWPIAVNARNAARGVDKKLIWSARAMGTKHPKLLFRVIIPASLPGILTGLQIAVPISLIISFVFEMLAGGGMGGLGWLLREGQRQLQSDQVWAAIFGVMIVGLILDRSFRFIRRRLLVWT